MKKKLKRTIAALSAIAMLFATATVLPEKLPVGVGITANAENSEIVESNSWLEVSCAENNYKTIDYTSSDENTYTCYVYSSTEYSAVLISVNGWSYSDGNGVLGYDNQVADLASKGARMPKFAELQILLDAGMNIGIFDNFNCQEYEMAYVEDGKWIGQDGNNKYDDSTYHAVFEINRNPIETVSDSIFKTDSSPTLSAVKGEDFTWQGNCDIEISYYNSDKTICDSAPAAAGDYYVKVSTPTIEADEDGNTVRYEASESDYIPFTIVHNFPDTFDSNGFKNCPKCNATVYQPAVETTDKYDIDDDSIKETVYEISNAGQLYWFAGLVNGTLDGVEQNTLANAILTTNITVNENLLDSLQYDEEGNVSNGSDFITWTPIADWMGNRTTQYSGTFDGNNKTVSGLYFNGDSTCIGLFGSSESDGNIKNVGVVDSYFKGNDHVGGVCGNNAGTITNCYNAGNLTAIKSSATIGGICGYNNGGTVTNCYNTGTVTATGSAASVGGVCGCSIELILNCYNIGTVTATGSDADISGICGYNFGPIKNCYYLADTEDENGGKTAAQFASGEIAYLLSQGCSTGEGDNTVTYDGSIWGQTIGTDTYPVLRGAKVYKNITYFGCNDSSDVVSVAYSNEDKTTYGDHDYVDGVCRYCDEEALASVTSGEIITYYSSFQDAIDYAENIPGSVVAVMSYTGYKTCYVNNPDSDFTIDINGNNVNGVTVNNGKITIIDSKANGEMQGSLVVSSDSIVTLGDVKISELIKVHGQLVLNGGDLERINLYENSAKVFFNNSDIKINNCIYWWDEYFEGLIINAELHNIIPIIPNWSRLEANTPLVGAGNNITLDVNWFNILSGVTERDMTSSIKDNKLIIGALINEKVKTEFEEGATFTYSGAELKPTVKVYINKVLQDDEQLIENTDYIVSYSDNINAGTATVTITGIGAYSGSKNVTFTIEPKKIDSPIFDGLKSEYTYTGQKVEPEFALMDGDTVIPSSEYEVSYSDNTEVGTATVTIKDASGGNYEVNCKAEFI